MRLWYHKQVLNFLPYKMCLKVEVEEGFGFSLNQGTGTSFSWHFQWVHLHWNLVQSCAPVKWGRGFKSPLPNNSIFYHSNSFSTFRRNIGNYTVLEPYIAYIYASCDKLSVILVCSVFNVNYYSFKIFPRFWLAKSTHIIHHNQLLMTKFGKILRLIDR